MPAIRNVAVGIPIRAGHVLVLDGVDAVKGESFHRLIGGGIHFGETGEDALRREFLEELDVSLDSVRLLGVVEDIFEYEDRLCHEVTHVFAVEARALDEIPLGTRLHVLDEGSPVGWMRISELNRPVYPTRALAMILDLDSAH